MSTNTFIPRTPPSSKEETSAAALPDTRASQNKAKHDREDDPLANAFPDWDLLPPTQFLRQN